MEKKYEKCRVSALAVAKMCKRAAEGGRTEVMGLLLGHVDDTVFTVDDAFALPVEATETRVNAMGEAYAYIVEYMGALRRARPELAVVGWYHSHPGYGCFLSQIDINTQRQNEQFQDPFVAIVVDPLQTARRGKPELGCFRTDSPTSFYELTTEFFTNALDATLLTLVDGKTWAKSIARALPITNQ